MQLTWERKEDAQKVHLLPHGSVTPGSTQEPHMTVALVPPPPGKTLIYPLNNFTGKAESLSFRVPNNTEDKTTIKQYLRMFSDRAS